jgi:hypothetical protein
MDTIGVICEVRKIPFLAVWLRFKCKVRETQHQNPEFGHKQVEIFKNLQKNTLAFNVG